MEQFGSFIASELYCPKCKSAQRVRERLLLILPSGELHEYLCVQCLTSLGQRTVTQPIPGPPQPEAHPPGRPPRLLLR